MRSFCLVLLLLTQAASADTQETLTLAQVAYRNGEFTSAASLYEGALAEGPWNGHILYNLGNAYFKSGDIGSAVAAYLAARDVLPRDPDIKANLQMARKDTVDKLDDRLQTPPGGKIWFWVGDFSLAELMWMTTFSYGLAGLCLAVSFWLRSVWFGRAPALFAFLCAMVFNSGYVLRAQAPMWGAIGQSRASVYAGPSDKTYSVVFDLHAGAPVAVVAEDGDWLQISLFDGKRGWVPRDSLALYGPNRTQFGL